jgi:hypothetical protein
MWCSGYTCIRSPNICLPCTLEAKVTICPAFSETFPKIRHEKKIKVTLVQALRLCTDCTHHKGSRGIALLFHDQWQKKGVRVQRHAPAALYPPGKDPVPTVQEAVWAPGPVWTGAENLAPTGIRSTDRPANSQSLIPTMLPGPQN